MAENESNRKQETNALTTEIICDVISRSIKEIVDMSKDEDFKKKCRDLVQADMNAVNLKTNLKEHFLKFFVKQTKKRSSLMDTFFNSETTERETISLESLIKDMFRENIDEDVNIIEELYGFDKWKTFNPENAK